MRFREVLLGLAIAAVAVVMVNIFLAGSTEPKELAVISKTGGLCANDSCNRSFTIYDDGSTSEPGVRTIVLPLMVAIETSKFRELSSGSGSCLSYVDGQDLVVRVPAWGEESYTVCKYANGNEDPLAIVAEQLYQYLNRASS